VHQQPRRASCAVVEGRRAGCARVRALARAGTGRDPCRHLRRHDLRADRGAAARGVPRAQERQAAVPVRTRARNPAPRRACAVHAAPAGALHSGDPPELGGDYRPADSCTAASRTALAFGILQHIHRPRTKLDGLAACRASELSMRGRAARRRYPSGESYINVIQLASGGCSWSARLRTCLREDASEAAGH